MTGSSHAQVLRYGVQPPDATKVHGTPVLGQVQSSGFAGWHSQPKGK